MQGTTVSSESCKAFHTHDGAPKGGSKEPVSHHEVSALLVCAVGRLFIFSLALLARLRHAHARQKGRPKAYHAPMLAPYRHPKAFHIHAAGIQSAISKPSAYVTRPYTGVRMCRVRPIHVWEALAARRRVNVDSIGHLDRIMG